MTKRVFLAGVFHETHTFLDGLTTLDEWSIRRAAEMLATEGDGSPLGGVVSVAKASGWDLTPAIDYRAAPSAMVADEVVERFWEELESAARPALAAGLDGVYFVLHGAMTCESFPDVEGEVLSRFRELPGAADLPVCGVLDLHCNFTQRMAEGADALLAYRENPHTDAEASAERAARLLDTLMRDGARRRTVFEQPPLMWPPTGVGSADDPMRSLEEMARRIEADHADIDAVNVFAGFAFADTPDTGVSFSAVTRGDPQEAQAALRRLSEWAIEHRELGNVTDPPIESVIAEALAHDAGPVLLVEPSDNIGGGAPGDGTGVLRALLGQDAQNAAVVINDPDAVQQCIPLAPGASVSLEIGGRGSRFDVGPVRLDARLVSTSDGRFDLEDRQSHLASMRGVHIEMGPCAVVRCGGVTILLTTHKTPPFDLGQLRSQGVIPESLSIIGVKAAVAHRRAYDPIAKASYTVDTPGPCSSNLKSYPFKKLRRPIFPLDEI